LPLESKGFRKHTLPLQVTHACNKISPLWVDMICPAAISGAQATGPGFLSLKVISGLQVWVLWNAHLWLPIGRQ